MNPAGLSGAAYWLPLVSAAVIALAVALYVVLDGFDLGIGILFPYFRRGEPARPDDELGRAVLGRQRDLAGHGRHRAVRRLPARLLDHHAGALRAGGAHAAGAGLPRRGVRVPLGGEAAPPALGPRLRRRLDHRRLRPGADPRRPAARHTGGGQPVRRSRVRLAQSLQPHVRGGAGHRLRADRGLLARHEDLGRGGAARARAGAAAARGAPRLSSRW